MQCKQDVLFYTFTASLDKDFNNSILSSFNIQVITIQPNGKVFVNGIYAQLPFSAGERPSAVQEFTSEFLYTCLKYTLYGHIIGYSTFFEVMYTTNSLAERVMSG